MATLGFNLCSKRNEKGKKRKVSIFLLELTDQSMQIGGQSSTGKSFQVDVVKRMFPKGHIHKITGMSDKAIRYLKDCVGTLYIAEWRALGRKDDETTAQFDVKLIISEKKLVVTSVVKSKEGGKWVTETYENDSIKNVISTSTDIELPKELRTRCWYLTLDESPEQTRRIAEWGSKQRSLPSSKRLNKEKEQRIFRCAVKKLFNEKPKDFIIPYMPKLLKIFDMNKVRVRRDKDKLELAIYAIALLHNRNRVRIEDDLVCLQQDFFYAWKYMDEAIMGTFTEKTKRFEEHWKLAEKVLGVGKVLNSNTFSVLIGHTERTARSWLKRFVEAGLLSVIRKDKRTGYRYGRSNKIKSNLTSVTIKLSDLNTEMQMLLKPTSKIIRTFGRLETL